MTEASAFREEQLALAYPDGVGQHFWNLARNRIVLRKLARGGPRAVVLDVGCGTGATVEFLRERGIDCLGVDLARVEIAEPLRPFVTVGTRADELPQEIRRRVGSVLLLDVLEHVGAPAEMLRGLRRAFPSLQRVVATVPARRELWSNYDEFFGHELRYDLVTLRGTMAALEPTRLDVGYFFHALYPAVVVQKALFGARSVAVRPPRRVALHRLLAACLSREEQLLPGSLPGSSAWAVADLGVRSR